MSKMLWQENDEDVNTAYVAISVDGIEICNGKTVYVKSIGDWHKLAIDADNTQGQRDYGMQGDILIAVKQMIEQNKLDIFAMVHMKIDELRKEFDVGGSLQGVANSHQATKLEKTRDFLYLLYDANKVGHKVDKEIGEALNMYRTEAGI
jgi:hypothetical protein